MKNVYKVVYENKLEKNLELIEFKDIKLGDLFTIRDFNVNNASGNRISIFKAISDSYLDKQGKFNISYCVYEENNFDIN